MGISSPQGENEHPFYGAHCIVSGRFLGVQCLGTGMMKIMSSIETKVSQVSKPSRGVQLTLFLFRCVDGREQLDL